MRRLVTKKEAMEILEILSLRYPDPRCELEHSSPFELLVSTMLSAQCTDVRVNQVTATIYPIYNRPEQFAAMKREELEKMIRSCGFYRNKAQNIIAASKVIVEQYGGEVPRTIEELVALPGVGKKTANVVASNAFGVAAIAVDTHVFRLSNRIGLVEETTVEKTEAALQRKIPKNWWTKAHHLMIHHGRRTCFARKPDCALCLITDYCRYYHHVGQWA